MAFNQSAGPPASGRQLGELLQLVQAAGHTDFRDARGPLRLTQRQAAGKFSRDEAQAFITQLTEQAEPTSGDCAPPSPPVAAPARQRGIDKVLEGLTSQALAAELQRRGWIVVEP
ncbi:MAG: hypothetical protein ACKV2O_23990 [Acidimicrobiales bacterium]